MSGSGTAKAGFGAALAAEKYAFWSNYGAEIVHFGATSSAEK